MSAIERHSAARKLGYTLGAWSRAVMNCCMRRTRCQICRLESRTMTRGLWCRVQHWRWMQHCVLKNAPVQAGARRMHLRISLQKPWLPIKPSNPMLPL